MEMKVGVLTVRPGRGPVESFFQTSRDSLLLRRDRCNQIAPHFAPTSHPTGAGGICAGEIGTIKGFIRRESRLIHAVILRRIGGGSITGPRHLNHLERIPRRPQDVGDGFTEFQPGTGIRIRFHETGLQNMDGSRNHLGLNGFLGAGSGQQGGGQTERQPLHHRQNSGSNGSMGIVSVLPVSRVVSRRRSMRRHSGLLYVFIEIILS